MTPLPQRAIPSVDRLLLALSPSDLPRPLIVQTIRRHLAALRADGTVPPFEILLADLNLALAAQARRRLQPVLNGTGILAHTNLGRSPLSPSAVQALTRIGAGYCNLEFDLETGERGTRAGDLEESLALAAGAPAATVVNNGAAALVLILRHLTSGPRKEVIISRGELVQIGGGFRIPEILETSGAELREIGTTNQTTLDDYARAISPRTALLLKVHRSNFFMEGFVASPSVADLAALANQRASEFAPDSLPVVEDLGSGALVDLAALTHIDHEPQPRESLRAGADLVCFSADKLLGGPQAGIIVGTETRIAAIKKDPFFRALRCDKLIFAALQATIDEYLSSAGPAPSLPILDMMRLPVADLRARAAHLLNQLQHLPATITIADTQARIGGGVCPRSEIPSVALVVRPNHLRVEALAARLRQGTPPVIARVADDAVQLDLRTLPGEVDPQLVTALRAAFAPP